MLVRDSRRTPIFRVVPMRSHVLVHGIQLVVTIRGSTPISVKFSQGGIVGVVYVVFPLCRQVAGVRYQGLGPHCSVQVGHFWAYGVGF